MLLCGPVSFVHLLSRGQQFVTDVGDDVTLECEFYTDEFNLFDNPILWRKVQLSEQVQMNMMGNLMEPFASTARFKVSFVPQPPRYVLTLFISGELSSDSPIQQMQYADNYETKVLLCTRPYRAIVLTHNHTKNEVEVMKNALRGDANTARWL